MAKQERLEDRELRVYRLQMQKVIYENVQNFLQERGMVMFYTTTKLISLWSLKGRFCKMPSRNMTLKCIPHYFSYMLLLENSFSSSWQTGKQQFDRFVPNFMLMAILFKQILQLDTSFCMYAYKLNETSCQCGPKNFYLYDQFPLFPLYFHESPVTEVKQTQSSFSKKLTAQELH